eukprot:TRINITY_DN1696_c0_g1_i30.p1 TRINITY_DN1696_c0_g1~~TRINITY_DN1696_c0_g1_i30.p1  ORF type:complete len:464 (-),score=78.52 TRINITY_DN1696_c0_g1_i30:70-1461(-)
MDSCTEFFLPPNITHPNFITHTSHDEVFCNLMAKLVSCNFKPSWTEAMGITRSFMPQESQLRSFSDYLLANPPDVIVHGWMAFYAASVGRTLNIPTISIAPYVEPYLSCKTCSKLHTLVTTSTVSSIVLYMSEFGSRFLDYGRCQISKFIFHGFFYLMDFSLWWKGWPKVLPGQGLTLITTQFGLDPAREIPPNLRMVGPILPSTRRDSILPRLEMILSEALENKKIVIYFSMGTVVNLQEKWMKLFKGGFGMLNQSFLVIWSLRPHQKKNHSLADLPENVHVFFELLPQLRILSHPSVHLFISHCGASSVIESMYYGVPIMALPVQADQFINAEKVTMAGSGLSFILDQVTEESFHEAIITIIHSPKIRKAARDLSLILKEFNGTQWSVREIETRAMVQNFESIYERDWLYPWWVRDDVDVKVILVGLVMSFVWLLRWLVSVGLFSWCSCCCCKKKNKIKND